MKNTSNNDASNNKTSNNLASNKIALFKTAWQDRYKLGDHSAQHQLSQFLPPILEIQEAPPNPLAKWLGRALIALLVIGIIWACIGEVNVVASAEGKIIPSSRVKQIQPLEKSVVKAILVKEGDYVEQGQPLVALDTALTGADEARIRSEIHGIQLRLAVNKTLLDWIKNKSAPTPVTNNSLVLLDMPLSTAMEEQLHKNLLWEQWQQYQAQYRSLQSSLAKNDAEQAVAQEVIKKLQQTLPIIERRTEKFKDLHQKHFASEEDYLQLEQERIQITQDLAAEKQRTKQLQAAKSEVKQQIQVMVAQTQTEVLQQVSDMQRQLASLNTELDKATDLNAKQLLYAPVSGRVQELAIATVGGVVMEAQQLMLIVPDEEQLEVEVFLENKDIGFVHEGLPAEVKIHTFPFTKYGVIDGEVSTISDDATVDEKKGLIYGMRVLMKSNSILVNGKDIKLMPGMAVTAEVKTGKRRIIEFFLAPLLRHGKEGLRER